MHSICVCYVHVVCVVGTYACMCDVLMYVCTRVGTGYEMSMCGVCSVWCVFMCTVWPVVWCVWRVGMGDVGI